MQDQPSPRKLRFVLYFMAAWSVCFAPFLLGSYLAKRASGRIRGCWPDSAAAALVSEVVYVVLASLIGIIPYIVLLIVGIRWFKANVTPGHGL